MKVRSKYKGLPFASDIAAFVEKQKIPKDCSHAMHVLLSSLNKGRRYTWKGNAMLAKQMGCHTETARKAVVWLEEAGIISVERQRNSDGTFKRNVKRFIFTPDVGFSSFTRPLSTVTAHRGPIHTALSGNGSEQSECNNNSNTSYRVKENVTRKATTTKGEVVVSEKNLSQEKKQLQAGREEKRENFAKERKRVEDVLAAYKAEGHSDPQRLLRDFGIEGMEAQLYYLPFRLNKPLDPAAFLDTAVRMNFRPPKGCPAYYNNEPEPAKPIPYDEGDGLGLAW